MKLRNEVQEPNTLLKTIKLDNYIYIYIYMIYLMVSYALFKQNIYIYIYIFCLNNTYETIKCIMNQLY
jgi:hypothetical protein